MRLLLIALMVITACGDKPKPKRDIIYVQPLNGEDGKDGEDGLDGLDGEKGDPGMGCTFEVDEAGVWQVCPATEFPNPTRILIREAGDQGEQCEEPKKVTICTYCGHGAWLEVTDTIDVIYENYFNNPWDFKGPCEWSHIQEIKPEILKWEEANGKE